MLCVSVLHLEYKDMRAQITQRVMNQTKVARSDKLLLPTELKILLTEQARKPRSYASLKLRLTHSLTYSLTRVKSRATSVAKKPRRRHITWNGGKMGYPMEK